MVIITIHTLQLFSQDKGSASTILFLVASLVATVLGTGANIMGAQRVLTTLAASRRSAQRNLSAGLSAGMNSLDSVGGAVKSLVFSMDLSRHMVRLRSLPRIAPIQTESWDERRAQAEGRPRRCTTGSLLETSTSDEAFCYSRATSGALDRGNSPASPLEMVGRTTHSETHAMADRSAMLRPHGVRLAPLPHSASSSVQPAQRACLDNSLPVSIFDDRVATARLLPSTQFDSGEQGVAAWPHVGSSQHDGSSPQHAGRGWHAITAPQHMCSSQGGEASPRCEGSARHRAAAAGQRQGSVTVMQASSMLAGHRSRQMALGT